MLIYQPFFVLDVELVLVLLFVPDVEHVLVLIHANKPRAPNGNDTREPKRAGARGRLATGANRRALS